MKQKIKKTVLGILAASMVLSTGTATTFAARTGCGHYYIDANGDGICDNRGSSQRNCRFTDKNKDGVCDICGSSKKECLANHKKGQNFVDKDGDGICDNRGNGNNKGNGRKHGNGCHNGRGKRR